MRGFHSFLCVFCVSVAMAQGIHCDLKEYKPLDGLTAEVRGDVLVVTWQGKRGTQLRAAFSIRNGQPMVSELGVRKSGGAWTVLGRELKPEFEVTSGKRRMSEQQLAPLRKLGPVTPEMIDRLKWFAFWDAPLMVPGSANTNLDMPRKPEEVRRAWASYQASGCRVKTDGARLEVAFPGL